MPVEWHKLDLSVAETALGVKLLGTFKAEDVVQAFSTLPRQLVRCDH